MILIGTALFIAGYQYIRRQADYVAAHQTAAIKPIYASSPVKQAVQYRNTLAYRLANPI